MNKPNLKENFPSTYFPSPDVEGLQSLKVQRVKRKLWETHHDGYAPEELRVSTEDLGGDKRAAELIEELRIHSVSDAQEEMDRLNVPPPLALGR